MRRHNLTSKLHFFKYTNIFFFLLTYFMFCLFPNKSKSQNVYQICDSLLIPVKNHALNLQKDAAWLLTQRYADTSILRKDLLQYSLLFYNMGRFFKSKKWQEKFGGKNLDESTKYFSFAINNFAKHFTIKTNKEKETIADLYINTASSFTQFGQIKIAKRYYEKALIFYQELENQAYSFDQKWLANYLYKPLGNVYTRLEDYENAESILLVAKNIFEEKKAWNHQAKLVNDLGIVYISLNKLDKAIQAYNEVLHKDINDSTKALLLSNRSTVFMIQQQYSLAQKDINEAIHLFEKTQNWYKLMEAFSVSGNLESDLYNHQIAIQKFNYAIEIGTQLYQNKSRELAKIFIGLAKAQHKDGNNKAALEAYNQALFQVLPMDTLLSLYEQPSVDLMYAENSILEALEGKAESFKRLYEKENNNAHLKNSLSCYWLIYHVEEKIRNAQFYQSSKLHLQGLSHRRNETAIDIAFRLYQKTEDKKHLKEALQFAEKSKSIVLLESLRKQINKKQIVTKDSLFTQEDIFLNTLAKLEQNIGFERIKGHQSNKENLLVWNKQKTLVSNQISSLRKKIDQKYPNKNFFRNEENKIDLEQIQTNLLNNNTALIEYFVGDELIYVFTITKNNVQLNTIEKQALYFLLKPFLAYLKNPQSKSIFSADTFNSVDLSFQIYQLLLSPILNNISPEIDQLIIIPDGLLSYLPFEVLQKNNTVNVNSSSNYLLFDYSINYAYSATILLDQKKHQKSNLPLKSFIGFAPFFKNKDPSTISNICHFDNLSSLIFNEEEVVKIAENWQGEKSIGDSASKSNFLKQAADYQILHLATHACIDKEDSNLNKIFFSDGPVYTNELYHLNLHAKMVVLSACETGAGQYQRGEGVMSLARSFAYAGTPSVTMSLWSVNDIATAELMDYYYQHLKEKLPKDKALRQAKLDFINAQETKQKLHPFYWAPFVHIGNTEAIDFLQLEGNENMNWFVIGGFFLCTLALVFFVFFKRRTTLAE